MAAENGSDPADLATSVDALGHDHDDVAAYASLAADLRAAVAGEVRFDEYSQVLYATDGSVYGARPAGVVCPRDVEDVQAAVRIAADHDTPVLPRGAGSSLAGQAVGPGCVVLDCSRHMDSILDVDPEGRTATVEPGVVQDHLDDRLAEHGLKFAPDPASANRATIGGGIGNNSTGAHSVRYGITDAYTEELRVVLADGSLIHTREVVLDSSEWEALVGKDDREAALYRTVRGLVEENETEIAERYPSLKRSVSGYNLHKVVYEKSEARSASEQSSGERSEPRDDDGEKVIDLSKLFVGAEGTLGVVVEATLGLVSVPDETALALYCFSNLVDAMAAVPEALDFDVSAVELLDDEVFRLAGDSTEFAQYAEPIPEGTAAALMVEFDSELCDDFRDAIAATNAEFVHAGAAFDVLEAYAPENQADLWKLRKAAIPLLMSLEGDPKPYPFIEDATVPPEELAEYVVEFEEILAHHDTSAAYFAHAGSGTLHVRPILNLKESDGIAAMHSIAEDVTSLVLDHDGAFSGEHGDGLARTEFNPKMYGPDLWSAFQELKLVADPDRRMNPGTVVYWDENDENAPEDGRGVGADMRENLRYGAEYSSLEPQTTMAFDERGSDENDGDEVGDDGSGDGKGFSHLVELCNGCGTCRQTDSETMCPTYRASREEIQTTRGRANLLRAAISGELSEEELYSERFQEEVLDLCIGCKGCASDCPTGVDMAKLKTEVKHQYHEREGVGRRDRLFADVDRLAALGSRFAPLSNWLPKLPGARAAMERTMGIARERELPHFARESLEDWFDSRGGAAVPLAEAEAKVLLFPDTYTNYSHPRPGKAAVLVLEAAGVHVEIPDDAAPSGRPAYSKGLLDVASERARTNVEVLDPLVRDGWAVAFVEPSDAVMFQNEYRDLLPDSEAATRVSESAYGVLEYLDRFRLDDEIDFTAPDESLTYHGHCNQKAIGKDHHAVGVLRRAGYAVDPLDSGCCGMAGSFGYEAEHYDLSRAIGRLLFEQVDASDADRVVAPGTSCRTQLGDRPDASRPRHPIEAVAAALDR